ncbi:MAG: leucine-rich repeat protein [Lachnospiraceae bacterium]|nr:leucine-rich repeat protein [Lachnospiraceae bacterium]
MKRRFMAMMMSVILAVSMFEPCSVSVLASEDDSASYVSVNTEDEVAGYDIDEDEEKNEVLEQEENAENDIDGSAEENTPGDEDQSTTREDRQATDESAFKWEGNAVKEYIGADTVVVIPDRCEEILHDAFYENTSITSVTIPSKVKKIGEAAFHGCSNLRTLIIETIDLEILPTIRAPFKGSPLSNVTLPEGMTVIPKELFAEVNFGEGIDIKLPSTLTKIDNEAFYKTTNLKTIVFPSGLKEIAAAAFSDSDLTSVTIPSKVNKIGEDAFSHCKNLTTLKIDSTDIEILPTIHPPFKESPLASVTLPEGMLVLPVDLFAEVPFAENIELKLPSTLTKIDTEAFYACKNLKTIVLPAGLKEISSTAFSNSDLTSITIPSKVNKIGEDAFSNCKKLTTLKIKSTDIEILPTIHPPFKGCPLSNVNLPEGMISLPAEIFAGVIFAVGMDLKLPSTLKTIGNEAFFGAENLEKIILPDSMEKIGDYAFSETELSGITIPSKVKEIGEGAFRECKKLRTISVNSAVLEKAGVGLYPSFSKCTVSRIDLSDDITVLPRGLFSNIVFIEDFTLVLPKNLTTIETGAFSSSTGIKSITFPVGIKTIKINAFSGCGDISEVIYEGSESGWKKVTIETGNESILNPTKYLNLSKESPLGPEEADLSQYTASGNEIVAKSVNLKKSIFAGIKGIKKFNAVSGNTAAVKIKGSTMTILGDGTVYVQALNKRGEVLAEKEIEVINPTLTITGTQMIYRRGNLDLNEYIKSTVQPASWKSSSKKIAEVNNQGLLTIKKSGTVKLTAKFPVQAGMKAKTLTIKIKIKMPQFKKKTYSVKVGKTVKTAVKNANVSDITYKIEDTTIATVDALGQVSGVSKGTTRLIMTVNDIEYYTTIKVK